MVANLDASGQVVGKPRALAGAARGRPTAIALGGTADGLRVAMIRSDRDDVTIDAATIAADGMPGRTWPLLDLDAPPSFDVALALSGDAILFDDVGAAPTDHRVRRAAVSWSR
jgi:hypothetical protein